MDYIPDITFDNAQTIYNQIKNQLDNVERDTTNLEMQVQAVGSLQKYYIGENPPINKNPGLVWFQVQREEGD